ncbi:MAG: hypothetical protein WBC90_00115 [Albidovulum sp.]
MSEAVDKACQRNCWIVSIIGAVLIAALLKFFAHYALGTALFFGILFLVLFGAFLSWAFCTGRGQDAAPKLAPMPERAPTPAPRQVAPAPKPAAEPAAADPVTPAASLVSAAPAAVKAAPAKSAVAAKKAEAKKAEAKKPEAKKPAAAKKAPAKTVAEKAPAKAATKTAKAPAAKAAPKPVKAAKPAKTAKSGATQSGTGLDAAMDKTKTTGTTAATTELLAKPRGGKGDDLKQIKGVGPALEKLLNTVGIWHFDQIASWKAKDIALVDGKMEGFKGRITRDEWVKQARVLAKGGATEFSKRVSKGEVY